ncbi:MAG: hypothetical protein ACOYMB_02230 [Patescibacteria group bacterium]
MENTWNENDGIINLSVTSYGLMEKGWINLFDQKGIIVSDRFKYNFDQEVFDFSMDCGQKFKPTKGVIYEIAIVKAENMFSDWRDRTTTKIRRKARQLLHPGADVIKNVEAFCLLSEEFSIEEFKKMGVKRLFGLNKSLEEINNGTGDFPPQLFILDFIRKNKILNQDNDILKLVTHKKGDCFAFIVSETNLSSLEPSEGE